MGGRPRIKAPVNAGLVGPTRFYVNRPANMTEKDCRRSVACTAAGTGVFRAALRT
jgi:hypothetical protein